jgi:hypothetical protein
MSVKKNIMMNKRNFNRIHKKITSQRCDVYFGAYKEVYLPHSGLLGECADVV